MREVVIHKWCDRHASLDPDDAPVIAGESYVVAVDGNVPQSLDLCGMCAGVLIDPLVALLLSHGAPVDDMPTQRRAYTRKAGVESPCPTCDYVAASAQGLGTHRSRMHGYRQGDDVAKSRVATKRTGTKG